MLNDQLFETETIIFSTSGECLGSIRRLDESSFEAFANAFANGVSLGVFDYVDDALNALPDGQDARVGSNGGSHGNGRLIEPTAPLARKPVSGNRHDAESQPDEEPRLRSDIDTRTVPVTFSRQVGPDPASPRPDAAAARRADPAQDRAQQAEAAMAQADDLRRQAKREELSAHQCQRGTGHRHRGRARQGRDRVRHRHCGDAQSWIRALLYTSPSYVPAAKERWRILLPLSENLPPDTRERLVARVNGLFGGKLAGESFVLSQAYLYGRVNDNPAHRVEVIDGDFIDLRTDLLDSGATGKTATAGKESGPTNGSGEDSRTSKGAIDSIGRSPGPPGAAGLQGS